MPSETFQQTKAIKDLTAAVKHLDKTLQKPSQINVYNAPSEEYHDENTLTKVHEALRENGYLPADIPGVISSFQNRGILFRERRESNG